MWKALPRRELGRVGLRSNVSFVAASRLVRQPVVGVLTFTALCMFVQECAPSYSPTAYLHPFRIFVITLLVSVFTLYFFTISGTSETLVYDYSVYK